MVSAIEFRTNPELQRFADEVDSFCAVVEKVAEYSAYDFAVEMDEHLSLLYALARRLPDIVLDGSDPDGLDVERDALSAQFNRRSIVYQDAYRDQLNDKLKARARYSLVFDPIVGGEPVESGFGNDIGSVYGDLKEALDLYRQGSEAAAQQAAWDWEFGLFHWGKHALNVVGATYALIHWHYDEDTGGFDR